MIKELQEASFKIYGAKLGKSFHKETYTVILLDKAIEIAQQQGQVEPEVKPDFADKKKKEELNGLVGAIRNNWIEPVKLNKGDNRLSINGQPPKVGCRVVAENYYQLFVLLLNIFNASDEQN